MRKGKRKHEHYAGGLRGGDASELSARLAPPEERASPERGSNNGGSIIIDASDVKLPDDLMAEGRESKGVFHLEPVALVIVLVALAFIAFIAWQISLMAPQGK
ncbi:MAG TPA: hypothetical protein VF507_06120 [Pyrinomonadaceae bacterium]|jgi:hypothetical protein